MKPEVLETNMLETGSHTIKHSIAIFILIMFTLIFFREGLFLNTRTINWDSAHGFYPNMYFMGSMFRNMDLPFWNPYIFTGYPAYTNIQSANFYPITFVFLLVTNFTAKTVYCYGVLHFFLAASFMYVLCFYYIRNMGASLVGAIIFSYSGFMVGHFQHLPMIAGVAWLPLIIYLMERSINEKRIDMACYGSIAFAMSILAGHPQTFFYIGCYIILHGTYRAVKCYYSNEHNIKYMLNAALTVFVICFLAILLSFVQLLPTYEFVSFTDRKGSILGETVFAGGLIGSGNFISFLLPNYFSIGVSDNAVEYWGWLGISQGIFYCTITGILLFFIGIIKYKINKDIIFFTVLVLFIILLVSGEEKSLYSLFYEYVPGFDKFRAPINMSFLFHFAFSIVASYGMYALYEGVVKNKNLLFSIGILLGLFSVLFLLSPLAPDELNKIRNDNINSAINIFFMFLILSILSINAVMKSKNLFIFVVPLVICLDLLVNLSGSVNIGLMRGHDYYNNQTEFVDKVNEKHHLNDKIINGAYLEEKEMELSKINRIHTEPRSSAGQVPVEFNRPITFKTYLTQGYDPLILESVKNIGTLYDVKPIHYMNITSSKAVITLTGQKFYIGIYKNPNNIFYFSDNVRFFSDNEELLEVMKYGEFNSKNEVFIEGDSFEISSDAFKKKDIEVLEYKPNSVVVNTQTDRDGVLVFSDTFYNGWKVFVDDEEQSVLKANYNFKAVYVPSGDHNIKFIFDPIIFWHGLLVTMLGLVSVIMLIRFAGKKSLFDFYSKV